MLEASVLLKGDLTGDAAVTSLNTAMAACGDIGRWAQALALYELGKHASHSGDAVKHLHAAHDIFERMGAAYDVERTQRQVRRRTGAETTLKKKAFLANLMTTTTHDSLPPLGGSQMSFSDREGDEAEDSTVGGERTSTALLSVDVEGVSLRLGSR